VFKRKDPPVPVEEAFPDPLTEHQRWILGLGAVLSMQNGENFVRLHPHKMVHPSNPRAHLYALKEMWGIEDRTTLVSQLFSLRTYGMRQELAPTMGRLPLAWDLGRYVNLVRWGFVCEFVDELAAWRLLEVVAKPVADEYDSWGSYARDYLDGRRTWNSKADATVEGLAMKLMTPSMADESPWQMIPWTAGKAA
jgi:hypothetical protein